MRRTIAASSARQARLLATLLGSALLLAALLAWRAYSAVTEQRAAVSRQLQDEAEYAAFMFATHAGRDVYWGLVDLFAPVTPHNEVRRGGPQVPLAALPSDPCEYDFTCVIRASARSWFRFDLRSKVVEITPSSARSSHLSAWLLDSIRLRMPQLQRDAATPFLHFFSDDSVGSTVIATVIVEGVSGPVAAYGLEVPRRIYGEQMIRRSTGESRPFLPASIRRGREAPYSFRLADRGGRAVAGDEQEWRRAASSSPAFLARIPVDSIARDLFAEVVLRGTYVGSRRSAAAPSWGLALILFMFALDTIVIGVVAIRLRRVIGENRWRANFTASASHELRTPLTQILLYGESLRDGTLHSERERRNAHEIIVREARHLLVLIENLLRFSRAEHRDGVEAASQIVVAREIDAIVDQFTPRLAMRQMTIETELDQNVENVAIDAELAAFRQLVGNLLDNAVKYGPFGQTILIGGRLEDGGLRIWIDDEGAGIPRAERERVWEPFVRLPSAGGEDPTGTGLGLTVVKQLARSLHGRVWIEDGPSGGARFVVSLPRVRVRAPEEAGV